ncbi:molybdopterin-binding protein, partial [Balneolaceae bacterium ANBcel3]|nr:molybdopterin-binding protein [Balneolaceae bacterium ANBcel3]
MKRTHTACLITIGNELLNGDIVNTNAAWLGNFLRTAGIPCKKMVVIPDDQDEILHAIQQAVSTYDLVVISGGLGPTKDDVTKEVLAEYFDDHLIRNKEVEQHVVDFFRKRGRNMAEENYFQADVPSRSKVLFNKLGTAPGLLFDLPDKLVVALPGVPYELKYLCSAFLLSEIEKKWDQQERNVRRHWFRITGIGESDLSARLMPHIEPEIQPDMHLAFLPHPGGVDVCLTQVNGESEQSFTSVVHS